MLKEKRKSEPDRTHFIKNDRIVSCDLNCDNSSGGDIAKSQILSIFFRSRAADFLGVDTLSYFLLKLSR